MNGAEVLVHNARKASSPVVLADRSYATLFGELAAVGVNRAGPQATAMFDLSSPTLGWTDLAHAMGVEARGHGPFLIEAVL